jgi:hypothetical protein
MTTTTATAAAFPLYDALKLVSELEPLFYTLIRSAEHHDLPEIRISTARAREIASDLLVLKKKLKSLATSASESTLPIDRHLDAIHNLNQ